MLYLGEFLVSWLSKRKSLVSLSTVKEEYIATTKLHGGVGVVFVSVILAPSKWDLSLVLGPDRLCCAMVIVATIT
jgi:hypothetical protein